MLTIGTTTFVGIHEKLEQDTTEDQMHHVLLCLNNKSRLKMRELHVLHLLFYLRESHTIVSRSDHIANELLTFNFVRKVKSIGSSGVTSECP